MVSKRFQVTLCWWFGLGCWGFEPLVLVEGKWGTSVRSKHIGGKLTVWLCFSQHDLSSCLCLHFPDQHEFTVYADFRRLRVTPIQTKKQTTEGTMATWEREYLPVNLWGVRILMLAEKYEHFGAVEPR